MILKKYKSENKINYAPFKVENATSFIQFTVMNF